MTVRAVTQCRSMERCQVRAWRSISLLTGRPGEPLAAAKRMPNGLDCRMPDGIP